MQYQLGQRFGEIVGLTWDRVDLKRGFITLRALDTKTKTARQVPMTPDVRAALQQLAKVRRLTTRHVFTYAGQRFRVLLGLSRQRGRTQEWKIFDSMTFGTVPQRTSEGQG